MLNFCFCHLLDYTEICVFKQKHIISWHLCLWLFKNKQCSCEYTRLGDDQLALATILPYLKTNYG